jgi:hypothetical protein
MVLRTDAETRPRNFIAGLASDTGLVHTGPMRAEQPPSIIFKEHPMDNIQVAGLIFVISAVLFLGYSFHLVTIDYHRPVAQRQSITAAILAGGTLVSFISLIVAVVTA